MTSYENTGRSRSNAETVSTERLKCEICDDWRWIRVNTGEDSPEIQPCECQKEVWGRDKTSRLIEYSGIGPLARMTFESAIPEGRSGISDSESFHNARSRVYEYACTPSGWLVLTGSPGIGKTHLAAAVVNFRIQGGEPARFESVPAMLDRIRNGDYSAESVALSTPLLVLDDLGIQTHSAWSESKIDRILVQRYAERSPTLIVAGKSLEALGERMQARLNDSSFVSAIHIKSGLQHSFQADLNLRKFQTTNTTFKSFSESGRFGATKEQIASLAAAKQAAADFAMDPKDWLYLCGPTGVGKTHLATAIVGVQMEFGHPCVFKFTPDLLDEMRQTFDPDNDTEFYRMFEQMKESELLILDDLGSQSSTPWSEEKLYQIIVHRHDRRLPTVITSRIMLDDVDKENYTPPIFTSRYAEPIASRLRDAHVVTECLMHAPDFRNRG